MGLARIGNREVQPTQAPDAGLAHFSSAAPVQLTDMALPYTGDSLPLMTDRGVCKKTGAEVFVQHNMPFDAQARQYLRCMPWVNVYYEQDGAVDHSEDCYSEARGHYTRDTAEDIGPHWVLSGRVSTAEEVVYHCADLVEWLEHDLYIPAPAALFKPTPEELAIAARRGLEFQICDGFAFVPCKGRDPIVLAETGVFLYGQSRHCTFADAIAAQVADAKDAESSTYLAEDES